MPSTAEYMRDWRARNQKRDAYNRACVLARSRALTRLARAHPDEYEDLVNDERSRVGLAPLGERGRGRGAVLIDGDESG